MVSTTQEYGVFRTLDSNCIAPKRIIIGFNNSWSTHAAMDSPKLQALVYDILPSSTAVFIYALGSRKLLAIEQFFVGAQTVVSLLQTTQIISDVYFMLPCCLRQLK